MSTFTMDDYHAAREHGGMSYDPATETREQGAVRSALYLARARAAFRSDPSAWVCWTDCDHEWDGDFPMAEGTILLDAVLYVDGAAVGSLGSVNVYSLADPYVWIIEAELYGEHIAQVKADALASAILAYCES